jgi:hypothetical protein
VLPEGREQRDMYDRLLCYVLLPDGSNFNLLLVELGKSPYFNKYGNCLLFHAGFVAAQARARGKQLGIWNPETNRAHTKDAPEARRDYPRLLAWWDARAEAINAFRAKHGEDPVHFVAADEPGQLARSIAVGDPVHLFAAVDNVVEERNGSWTVTMVANDKERAVRVVVPAGNRSAFGSLDPQRLTRSYRQNYVWIIGTLSKSGRGYTLLSLTSDTWRLAGPEPKQ